MSLSLLFFRSAFNTEDILMEAKKLSNQSLTIRLAVKLPPCVEGSFSARTLEKVVTMNKDAVENVTSADLQGVDVIIPSLQPGISSSEASKRRADGLPFSRSLLSYAIIASCVSVVLILIAIAFWKFRRRRKTFARIIKVAPVDAEYWVTEDTFALVPGSPAEEKNDVGVVDDQDTCPSIDHPCAVDV
ncbi:uncharacterized protein [Porites lutea]|uniref:uncharacterized protein n=1 Tax=Porites lutea TaxID=51062 RepID=UPI003CC5D8BD